MMHYRSWACLLAIAGASPVDAESVIEGTISLPPPRTRSAAAARYKLKSGQVLPPEPQVAVVYLEGDFAGAAATTQTNRVEQRGFQFFPAVIAIQKGGVIKFPNNDDDYHHVFSYSKAKEFDLGRYRKEEKPPEVVFTNPGAVRVGCEIHDHMRATVLVLETPYFTRTDPRGRYSLVITGVPAGRYKLKAWINDRITMEQSVDVKPDESMKVDFNRR